jgi:hypothetical protein
MPALVAGIHVFHQGVKNVDAGSADEFSGLRKADRYARP